MHTTRHKSEAPPGYVTNAKHEHVVAKYNSLHEAYRGLEKKYDDCKAELETTAEQCRGLQDSVNQWKDWVKKNWDKLYPKDNDSRRQDADEEMSARPSPAKHASERIVGSSQTTEDGPRSSPPVMPEKSDDEVEFVSEKIVKKPGRNAAPDEANRRVRIKQEPNTPENPLELASDDFSSPHLKRKQTLRTETSNLDALGVHFQTPRKRRCVRAASEGAAMPIPVMRKTSSLSQGDVPVSSDTNVHDRLAGLTAEHTTACPSKEEQPIQNALRELSANVPCSPRRTGLKQTAKPKRRGPTSMRDVAILTEDGDMQASQIAAAQPEPQPKANLKYRLDDLLEHQTPDKMPLAKRQTPQTVIRHNLEAAPTGTDFTGPAVLSAKRPLQPRNNMTGANVAIKRESPAPPPLPPPRYDPAKLRKSPVKTSPEDDEPLRSRPLSGLNLDDFRINPKYLGSEFAFADTLRGRDQRRCLTGCTRPDCCGNAFLKVVELGAIPSKKSDSQLLEDYLGPDYDQILKTFGAEKQKTMLMQARAYAFANQHGKHRQAFERAQSPPGFWRTDMPTTQEAEEDRSKARELERQKVEERWRDALRPGGRWVFRDEVGG